MNKLLFACCVLTLGVYAQPQLGKISNDFQCETSLRSTMFIELAQALGTWNQNPGSLEVNQRLIGKLMDPNSASTKLIKNYCSNLRMR